MNFLYILYHDVRVIIIVEQHTGTIIVDFE